MYVAIYKCVILVILHIFKISYQLGNIEQCYLPGKMADNMHSHEKSNHFMSILPSALFPHSYNPQLLLLFDPFLSGFTSLSFKSAFCAVSGYLWLFLPQKSENSADLVPLCHVSSLLPNNYWCYLTHFYLC